MRPSTVFAPDFVNLFAWLCTVHSVAFGVFAQSIPETLVATAASNVTAGFPSSDIDPRFSYRLTFNEVSLPKTPLFLNTMEFMAQHAMLGWMSKVKERHGVVLQAYPQIEMAVIPAAPATSVENRLIVWSIWVVINSIISRNAFNEVEIDIGWDDKVVAYMYFTKPLGLQGEYGNGTQDQIEEDLDLLLDLNKTTASAFNTSINANIEWLPRFIPGGKTLTPVEAFVTILAALKNAAPPATTDKVLAPFTSSSSDIDAHMAFYFHGRSVPRTTRPFFQYGHIIEVLRLIPGYLLEKRKFADLGFGIGVNGILIANGFLVKGPYSPPNVASVSLLGLDYNATIS